MAAPRRGQRLQGAGRRQIALRPAAGEGHKAGKLKVKEERVAGVAKVIGLSKLK